MTKERTLTSRKRGTRALAALLALLLTTTACLGPNNTTGRLMKWNRSFENKWGQEVVFFVIFPAYIITALGDTLIFNSCQWWSGKNPVDPPSGPANPVTG